MDSVDLVITLGDHRHVRLQASNLRPLEGTEEEGSMEVDMRILLNGSPIVDGWIILSRSRPCRFGVPLAQNGEISLCVSQSIDAFSRSLPDEDAAAVEQGLIDVIADLEFEQGD